MARRIAAMGMGCVLALIPLANAKALGPHPDMSYLNEAPSAFVPGKYYFGKATFYLKNDKVPAAIDQLRVAASWGHKFAQYDLGVIYFNGLGVAANRPLGTAWFGIAAQNHGTLADQSLLQAWQMLTTEERRQASVITDQLMSNYNDAATFKRAKSRFLTDLHRMTGSHLGYAGNVAVTQIGSGDGIATDGARYVNEQRNLLDETIHGISGRVDIGNVQAIGLDGRPLPTRLDAEEGR